MTSLNIVFGSLTEDDVSNVSNKVELPKKQQQHQQKNNKKNTLGRSSSTHKATTNDNNNKTSESESYRRHKYNNNNKQQHYHHDNKKKNKFNQQQEKKQQEEIKPKPKSQIVIEHTDTNAWQTPTSFADLINSNNNNSATTTTTESSDSEKLQQQKQQQPQQEEQQQQQQQTASNEVHTDKKKKKKRKSKYPETVLESTSIDYEDSNVFIIPRGLANVRNSCYINASLQGLLYVPSFYNLFKKLGSMNLNRESYPLTRSIAQFVHDFRPVDASTTHIEPGPAFTPQSILDYMKHVNTNILKQGDQHDTHEFILFILQHLHTELTKTSDNVAQKLQKEELQTSNEQEDEDEWKEVGKNNKASTVREVKHEGSAISDLFSGKMRSLLKKKSVMGSLTLQPYYSLHVPIDDSRTTRLTDALRHITSKEQIENAYVEYALEEVPKVLVIQLNRFEFDDSGSKKISKHIEFPVQLYLDKNVISSAKMTEKDPRRNFELVSVICHHGKEPSGGHYSTFIYHPCKKWIHFDDSKVTIVTQSHVLSQQAYVLIYKQQ
jgi:ubiquitin C-terminal hydrolase